MVVDISSLPESFYKLKRVCIQIPEILLGESDQILEIFVKSYPNIEFLLVLDSLGGSCCPDFVARERVQAEALVKVGVSCIADTEAYFSVPTRDDYILLRTYQSALNSLDQLCLDQKFVCIISRAVVSSKEFLGCQNKGFQIAHVSIQKAMTGRLDGVLLFMHLYDWEIELLLLINPSSISFNWDGTTWRSITASRIRAKRFNLLSGLQNTVSIGIILQSSKPSALSLNNALVNASRCLGHSVYTFSVADVSITKLGNFPDIRVWTILGCSRVPMCSSLIQILTPFELCCGIGLLDFWQCTYTLDYEDLLLLLADTPKQTSEDISPESSTKLLPQNLDFSAIELSKKSFRGISYISEVDHNSTDIELGETGIPRSYRPISSRPVT